MPTPRLADGTLGAVNFRDCVTCRRELAPQSGPECWGERKLEDAVHRVRLAEMEVPGARFGAVFPGVPDHGGLVEEHHPSRDREPHREIGTFAVSRHRRKELEAGRRGATEPGARKQPVRVQQLSKRVLVHRRAVRHVQDITGAVSPISIRDDRIVFGMLGEGVDPRRQRSGQQKIVVVQRGEEGRLHRAPARFERSGNAGLFPLHDAESGVGTEPRHQTGVPARAIDCQERNDTHAVLLEHALDRVKNAFRSLGQRQRRNDDRYFLHARGPGMELDAEHLSDGARLDTDLCIVGAGPAGLTIAHEYIRHGIDVLLLESGGRGAEDWPQSLNEGTGGGDCYAGLRATRHRQVGGTAHIWNTPVAQGLGAKYVPLDPWDLDAWPIRWEELVPFYERAQRIAGLGPFAYEGSDWTPGNRQPLDLGAGPLSTRVYQFGSSRTFPGVPLAEIGRAQEVRLCYHATVCRLWTDDTGGRVTEARIRCRTGREIAVRARVFILAAGAVENARLLFASSLGNRSGWVGRGFMEHPRDRALCLAGSPALFDRLAFFDAHPTRDGITVGGRIAPTAGVVREHRLVGFSGTFFPRRRVLPPARGLGPRLVRRIRSIVAPPPSSGYGWSRRARPDRWFEGFGLLLNLEQRPHPDNRVVLGADTDELGVPRAVLEWRWRPEEQAVLERLRALVAAALQDAGLGPVRFEAGGAPDPNAHHHAGTTRMSPDERDGVVDPDGRVHGIENLYVTGASVFPTAGFANPTLTILALATRLADHLRGRFVPGA